MSQVSVEFLDSTNDIIEAGTGNFIKTPNNIVQTVMQRYDTQITLSTSPTGDGITISDLNLSITPKFADSLLVLIWMINGELHQDAVFLVHRDGSLITDPNFEGYNAQEGNNRFSGIMSAFYDRNESSTPSNWYLQFGVPAFSTASRTYAPAVRSSSNANRTFALNRTISSPNNDANEAMVSTGLIMEIAQ